MPPPSVPIDCISLILNHVDHSEDLFSCLTVSKAVFPQAARILYIDPLRHFETLSTERKKKLLSRLLTLSPANNKDTNYLRRQIGVTHAPFNAEAAQASSSDDAGSSTTPSQQPPMLDYLSFVRIVRWDADHVDPFLQFFPGTWPDMEDDLDPDIRDIPYISRLRNTLTQAIGGHQLEQIVDLELEASALGWALDQAPRFNQLQSITISRACSRAQVTQDYQAAIRLVKAIQDHHGGRGDRETCRLRQCHFTASPILDIMASPEKMLAIVQAAVELDQLLQVSSPSSMAADASLLGDRKGKKGEGGVGGGGSRRGGGGGGGATRVLDAELARMKTISIQDIFPLWTFLVTHYGSATEVLRRCRQVRLINAHIRPKQANLFQWAVEEAEQHAHERLAQTSSRRRVNLVPVETIDMHLLDWTADDETTVLHDIMNGFGATLEKLWIRVRAPNNALPATIRLEGNWAPSHLQNLAIRHDGPFSWEPQCLEQRPIHLTSLVVMLQTTDVEYNRGMTPLWPILHLPKLKNLSLGARAINAFDPASLYHMPLLEVLDFHAMAEDRVSFGGARPWSESWTWDWPLPRLRRLYIYAISTADDVSFNFRMLKMCPVLDLLELYFDDTPYRLRARAQLQDTDQVTETPLQELAIQQASSLGTQSPERSNVFGTIETFCLRGPWYQDDPDELRYLLACMPRLDTLDVSIPAPGGRQIKPILHATCDHPSLNVVEIPDEADGNAEDSLDELDLVAFGLKAVDPDDTDYGGELSKCQYLVGSGCYRLEREIWY